MGKLIPFPRKPLPPESAPYDVTNDRPMTRCEDLIHVYASLPGRCQCGENFWDGTHNVPDGIGVYTPPAS